MAIAYYLHNVILFYAIVKQIFMHFVNSCFTHGSSRIGNVHFPNISFAKIFFNIRIWSNNISRPLANSDNVLLFSFDNCRVNPAGAHLIGIIIK